MISLRPWLHKHYFFFFLLLRCSPLIVDAHAGRGVISPLVDYDEWLPLGRGDPLRNDPTYDYMPPTLDRVNYWQEPEARTPDLPPNSQVLLLGFPSSIKKSAGKLETKKVLGSDSRRDGFMQLMNERKHSLSRVAPQYIPLQGAYRPPAPMTMLMPPPPTKYIPTTAHQETTTTTTPTTSTTTPRPTTFATPEATTSATSQIHKVLAPVIDISPSGQQSLSSSLLQIILQNEMATSSPSSTTPAPPSSTPPHPTMTSDPLFSHYKQPTEPLKGPMYLIIQGHSKVKTYGASKLDKLSKVPSQDSNEVEEGRRSSRGVSLDGMGEMLNAVLQGLVDTSEGDWTSSSSLEKLQPKENLDLKM